jgi:hypothetical protein
MSIRCKILKPGSYIVMIQGNMPIMEDIFNLTFSVYTPTMIDIQKIKKPDGRFLEKVFLNHAFKFNSKK